MLISRGAGVSKYLTQVDLDEGLCHAAENRRNNIAKLFLDNGARIHDCLERAASQGDAAIVRLLLDHSAETDALTDRLNSALRATLWNGHLDVLKLLLDRGADVNSPFRKTKYMLELFSLTSRKSPIADCLRFLLDNGAGIDMETDSSLTVALYVTIHLGLEEASRLLLERGAKLNEVVGQEGYPLQAAVTRTYPDIEFIRYLLELGADPNAQGGASNTALQAFCSSVSSGGVFHE
jgi:ankyrin repeat protein